MDFKDVRELFIGTKNKTFLDSACVGLIPITAKNAIIKFLDIVAECNAYDASQHHIALDEMRNEAVTQAALLLNTETQNISLIENTTHGLNIAANSIPFSPSDEVIISNTEYLQVAIPFMKKQEFNQLRVVPLDALNNEEITLADFERRINNNTKAICLSSVQWCTGQRLFTKKLSDLCQARGIWLIVDGIQELGALCVDMTHKACDFYIAGGHKWLNAPFGCGIMYMSKRAQELEPPGYGYLNLHPPQTGWGNFFQDPMQTPFREYVFPKCAKTFSIGGTGNYPGAIGLSESIKVVNHIGAKKIEERILGLTKFLRKELAKTPAQLMLSLNPNELSGITIFRLGSSLEDDLKALAYLLEKRIFLSIRYTNGHGGIRASTHYYNNEEDILRLCHTITALFG
jgi:cysteine desulfurase / selenocysteine lyase